MIPLLAPFFSGPLRPYGERVSLANAPYLAAVSPALDMQQSGLDRQWASACLHRFGQARACSDAPALAAAWFRDYTLALLPSALVAAARHRHSLPFDAAQLRWQGDEDGRLLRIVLPHDGAGAGEGLRAAMRPRLPALLSPLLGMHLPIVAAALADAARVAPRLLWCTAGVAADGVARHLAAHPALGEAARAEIWAWMREPRSADGLRNPFHGAFRPGAEPGVPGVAPVRRICCLNYRLPAGGLCGTCPRNRLSPGVLPYGGASGATAAVP
ncbi:siderophore-iron reductase FhuF [Cupriavidus sp. AU9028]|nr:siderophore-iron reductase FhuF [Cupriavidus sp. AU9028]